MKTILIMASLGMAGSTFAQTPPAPSAVTAPAATVAAQMPSMPKDAAMPAPVMAQPHAVPAPVAPSGPVPPCSKTVHDGCANTAPTAKHHGHHGGGHHHRKMK